MTDTYMEIMVKKETSPIRKIGQLVCALLAGFFAIAGVLGFLFCLVLAALLGVACYILTLYSSVEYEYLYVDKELQIDRILAKSRRKRMETLDLRQIEVMAPVSSHQLDSFRNSSLQKKDYSSGNKENLKNQYVLMMQDRQIVFEPSEEMVKTIQMIAPRKVFTY